MTPQGSDGHGRPATRDLDYAPLTRRVGLGERLRAVAANNVWVIGATVSLLIAVVPLGLILFFAVATPLTGGGFSGDDGVVLAVLLFFLLCGALGVTDVLAKAGGAGGFARFAEVNDLESIVGEAAVGYAASEFADGSHLVMQAVRTRERSFVEVGDRFPTTPPRDTTQENRAQLYLRVRFAGPVAGGLDEDRLVTPELAAALTRFAGPYTVEKSTYELTLTGDQALDPTSPGRVEEAFALADALGTRAEVVLGARRWVAGDAPAAPEPTPSGIPVPLVPEPAPARGRPPRVTWVVLATLAVVIGLPLALAVVMSSVEGSLRGNELGATIAVSLIIAVFLAVVGLLVRWSVAPRRRSRQARRR